jgi:hypothetical protein
VPLDDISRSNLGNVKRDDNREMIAHLMPNSRTSDACARQMSKESITYKYCIAVIGSLGIFRPSQRLRKIFVQAQRLTGSKGVGRTRVISAPNWSASIDHRERQCTSWTALFTPNCKTDRTTIEAGCVRWGRVVHSWLRSTGECYLKADCPRRNGSQPMIRIKHYFSATPTGVSIEVDDVRLRFMASCRQRPELAFQSGLRVTTLFLPDFFASYKAASAIPIN